jgi:hypothetical protein
MGEVTVCIIGVVGYYSKCPYVPFVELKCLP